MKAAVSANSANPPAEGMYANLPAPGPLPDEFGLSSAAVGSPTGIEAEEPRRLMVSFGHHRTRADGSCYVGRNVLMDIFALVTI